MTITEKLQTIAENEQKVYDAGYAKGKAEGGGTEESAYITITNDMPAAVNIYLIEGEEEGVFCYGLDGNETTTYGVSRGSMIAIESPLHLEILDEEGNPAAFVHREGFWGFISCYKTKTVILQSAD